MAPNVPRMCYSAWVKRKRPPRSTAELIAEASILYENGALTEAARTYRQALAQEPDHVGALNLLAIVLSDRGDPAAALPLIQRAIELDPGVAASHLNLGMVYAKLERDVLAVDAMHVASELDPGSAMPLETLAKHHISRNQPERAIAALRRALARDPASATVRFLIAGLTGDRVDATPAVVVEELFDSYAPSFEDHLVQRLHYRVPEQLEALVVAAGNRPERAWRVFDLGCGTGLCGAAFRPFANHLVGSDLSTRMIEIAGSRGLYDELHTEDLVATLRRADADVDLVVAGDVLIYVGALEPTFAACASALRDNGLFAFSTERCDGDGFRLLPSLRYAHSDGYVRALAERAGFAIAVIRDHVLRTEQDAPIVGALYLLARLPR